MGDHENNADMGGGCYTAFVANPNPIWQSESVLLFHLPGFAAQVAFTVLATRFLYYALRPFHQPHIVCDIIAAFMLSPDVFGQKSFVQKIIPIQGVLPIETISYMGLVYYIFLTGLDMNIETVLRAGKKPTNIAVAGTVIPMAFGVGFYALVQNLYKGPAEYFSRYNTPKAYLFWSLILSVTGFPVLAHILADLKLLYTGLGRVALTSAMISDFYNWVMFALLIPFAISDDKTGAMYAVLSNIAFVLFCCFVLRPFLVQLLARKANQNEWDNSQLFYVIIGAFACAGVTDILGTHGVVGALVYGLIIPRGRLTDMLIERSEDFVAGYLAPLFFARYGIRLNFLHVVEKQGFTLVAATVLLSCIPKVLSTVIATQFYGMPALDGLALGLLMNTKGILPLLMLNIAWDKEILSGESFSIMVAAILVMTLIVPPIINAIYRPRKRFEQNKLRTIENLKVDAELRIMACVHNTRHATGMINILEACNATKVSPLRVFALQLLEHTGNATSLLAAHIEQPTPQQGGAQALTKSQQDLEGISNSFEAYAGEQDAVKVEILAAVSSYATMHKDICNLAQEKQATLILLPFHKQSNVEGFLDTINTAFRHINQYVMQDAPCSLGIFVDRGLGSLSKVNLHILMPFIGGPDDREALSIAWRMSRLEGVQLSMVRILLLGETAEVDSSSSSSSSHVEVGRGLLSEVLDNEKQKNLDEEYVSSFRLKAVSNEDSITYSEREVHSADDILVVLNELNQKGYDLYIVGQGKGRNSLVSSNLLEWSDCPELGVIGDIVASNSFGSCSSLLVVQQYGFGGMVFETNSHSQHSDEVPDNIMALGRIL